MKAVWKGKKISGILTVLPEHECSFEDTILAESVSRIRRLKRIIGFDKRRRTKKDTNVSDLYKYGLSYMLENRMINKEEIGAIVVVTLTQDYLIPQVSHILHGEFSFPEDTICIDIPQACAGYVVGLAQAFMLLNHLSDKKVLLFTGDILNRERENEEKSEEPAFGGDAASISVIENNTDYSEIYFRFYSDGSQGENLIIPAGAFKYPVYTADDAQVALPDGRIGNGMKMWMDGSFVFNFVEMEVPPLINGILEDAGKEKEDMAYYFFHQPNRFILEKLVDSLGIPTENTPMDLVAKYGNSNSSTIPMVITDHASQAMLQEKTYCCLAGFGAGLAWAALVMELGEMDFCRMIESTY